jgi:hypothetical protein
LFEKEKLLRNVVKFFMVIVNQSFESEGFRVIRQNFEEIVLNGPNGHSDVRIVNSYPSKVSKPPHECMSCLLLCCTRQPRVQATSQLFFCNIFITAINHPAQISPNKYV